MSEEQFPGLPLREAHPELAPIFEEMESRHDQRFAALLRHPGVHFEKEPPIQAEQLNTIGFPIAEKERLEALCADADFLEASTRRDQIAIAEKHLRGFVAGRRMTFEAIGRFFGVSPAIIQKQMQSAKTPTRLPGRHSVLSNELKLWIADLVHSRTLQRNPITDSELLDLLESQHQVVLCADTLRHVIRNMDSVKTIVGRPMEAERVAVNPDEISAWFDRLRTIVDGIPRGFVFNMDETGCSDYTDSREVRVIAPIGDPEPWIAVPSDRHSKRSTFVACIAADGFRMKPFVIVPRVTAEKELRYYGYDESNAVLTFQTNAFMTSALFELWATTVFFPTVDRRRRDLAYDGRVLLLLDGLGSHHTAKFLSECETRKIEILPLIPHASDQIQPLDLLTFAMMKQTFSASKFNQLANPQSNKIVRMLGAWFAASAPHHNVEAFMSVGLIPVERDGRFFLTVVPEKARRVRGSGVVEPAGRIFPLDAGERFRLPTGI
jgi:hypothetical protein